jgi:hypothetical protein
MFNGIGFQEFNADEYRAKVMALSDEELLRRGKELRALVGNVVSAQPCAFDRQLMICREEFSRRHPNR